MKKKFRKTIALLAAAAMALALPACQQDSGEIHSLEFPDASWGTFAEEVMDTYEVTQADLGDGYQIDDTGNGSLTIPGVSAFGEASEKIVFQFAWIGELEQVRVYYPEDADMEKVLEGMKAEYGEPARSASKYTAKGEEAACDSGGESSIGWAPTRWGICWTGTSRKISGSSFLKWMTASGKSICKIRKAWPIGARNTAVTRGCIPQRTRQARKTW